MLKPNLCQHSCTCELIRQDAVVCKLNRAEARVQALASGYPFCLSLAEVDRSETVLISQCERRTGMHKVCQDRTLNLRLATFPGEVIYLVPTIPMTVQPRDHC